MIGPARAKAGPVWSKLPEGDTHLLWIPFRGAGAAIITMATAVEGMHSVMVAGRAAGPEEWGALIGRHNVTYNILFGASMHEFAASSACVELVFRARSCCSCSRSRSQSARSLAFSSASDLDLLAVLSACCWASRRAICRWCCGSEGCAR